MHRQSNVPSHVRVSVFEWLFVDMLLRGFLGKDLVYLLIMYMAARFATEQQPSRTAKMLLFFFFCI